MGKPTRLEGEGADSKGPQDMHSLSLSSSQPSEGGNNYQAF